MGGIDDFNKVMLREVLVIDVVVFFNQLYFMVN